MSKRKDKFIRVTLEIRTNEDGRVCAEVVGLRYSTIGATSPLDAACRVAELAAIVFREEIETPKLP